MMNKKMMMIIIIIIKRINKNKTVLKFMKEKKMKK